MLSPQKSIIFCGAMAISYAVALPAFAEQSPALNVSNPANKSSSIKSIKKAPYGRTEPAFFNKYWNNKEDGIYVDPQTGEALFSSNDKFDSGTGWPSFTKPLNGSALMKRQDTSHGMKRVEVATAKGSHLGHVFNDGPKEAGGARYCVNSYALRFIPKSEMEAQGYGKYVSEFE